MRDILVSAGRFDAWTAGVRYAAYVAERLAASLTGVYIHASPLYMMPPHGSAELLASMLEIASETEAGALAAAPSFARFAAAAGVTRADWQVGEGYLPDMLARIGNWHDLLVLGRDDECAWSTPQATGMLVVQSALPCIVVPAATAERAGVDCIAIAWNGAPESVRALQAAMPLLERAARVVLLVGDLRDPYPDSRFKPPFDAAAHLNRHGIGAEEVRIDVDDAHAGEALLAAASRVDAELLVMGAYGRSRFSEWAFGGATRHVLAHAGIPLFMRH